MARPVPIGIAVVERDGCYLVGVRPSDVPLAGCAEFPGGKCGPDEDPAECACRECREETGVEVCAERLLLRRQFDYPHGSVDLHFWLCRPLEHPGTAKAGGGFRWVAAQELCDLPFPPANAPLLGLLASGTVYND